MLLILFVSLFAFCNRIAAKNLLKIEKNVHSQQLNRNERGLGEFVGQINFYSDLELSGCDFSSCPSLADSSNCPAYCQLDNTLFQNMLDTATQCLKSVQCLRDLNDWQINHVNFTLGVDGFNGQCYLYGEKVRVTGGTDGNVYSSVISPKLLAYKLTMGSQLIFNGLSVYCKSCPETKIENQPSGTFLSGLSCPLNNLINLGALFGNNRRCNNSGDVSSGKEFRAGVTVTQKYSADYYYGLQGMESSSGDYGVGTEIEFASGIPDEYQSAVENAIRILMETYAIARATSHTYLYYVTRSLIESSIECPRGKLCP